MEKEPRENGLLIPLIIFIVLTLSLSGYIFYDKILSNNLSTEKPDIKKEFDSSELSDKEKVNINEKLVLLEDTVFDMTGIDYNDFVYDTDYLQNDLIKYVLVWETMLSDQTLHDEFQWDINSSGEEETGSVAIKTSILKEYYKKIIGKEMNEQDIVAAEKEHTSIRKNLPFAGVEFVGDMTYGSHVTGRFRTPFVLKVKSLTYDATTNNYSLLIDFLAKRETGNEHNSLIFEEIENYTDSSIISYPKEMVYSTIEIKYEKGEEGNIIKSFVVRK